jgi:predicted SAM-dependent methyltransferase
MNHLQECPACGSVQHNALFKCKDYTVSGLYFTVNQCISCELKFTNPIPDEIEIGKYYQSDEYVSHNNSSKGFINSLYQWIKTYTIKRKVSFIRLFVSGGATILDYGAGTGAFLNALSLSGFRTYGIEPSQLARQFAKTQFNVELMDKDGLDYIDKQSIKCITLWHVLEHLHSLNQSLERFNQCLTAKGYLLIAVPNADSYDAKYYGTHWAAYDVPRHLYHFNHASLIRLVSSKGFKLVKKKSMLFDATYVSLLSEKYKKSDQHKNLSVISYLMGFIIGLISNISALFTGNASSHVYVFQKVS